MQVFRIETYKYPKKNPNVFLTREVHSRTNGILCCYTGCADTITQFESFKSRIVDLSKKYKIDLSTQICINVGINHEGKYRGFTIVYISNDITYCLLIGKDPGGQDIIIEEVDTKATKETLKKFGKKSLANLSQEELDKFDQEYEDIFYSIPEDKRIRQPLILAYKYKPEDVSRLGDNEIKKKVILDNLGKITISLPNCNLATPGNNTLHTKNGYDTFDESFFQGLFNIFPGAEIQVMRNDTYVKFKNDESCFFASMLYKTVLVDNEIITFNQPRNEKRSVRFYH